MGQMRSLTRKMNPVLAKAHRDKIPEKPEIKYDYSAVYARQMMELLRMESEMFKQLGENHWLYDEDAPPEYRPPEYRPPEGRKLGSPLGDNRDERGLRIRAPDPHTPSLVPEIKAPGWVVEEMRAESYEDMGVIGKMRAKHEGLGLDIRAEYRFTKDVGRNKALRDECVRLLWRQMVAEEAVEAGIV